MGRLFEPSNPFKAWLMLNSDEPHKLGSMIYDYAMIIYVNDLVKENLNNNY